MEKLRFQIVIERQKIGCAKTVLRALGVPRACSDLVVKQLEQKLSLGSITTKITRKICARSAFTRSCCTEDSTPWQLPIFLIASPLLLP